MPEEGMKIFQQTCNLPLKGMHGIELSAVDLQ
jgi:hypothetical protein